MGIDHSNPYIHSTTVLCDSPHTSRKRQTPRDVRVPDGSNSAVITGLDPNLDYDVTMYATTSVGEGPRSQPATFATTECSSDPTAAIIGGVVAVVIVLIIAITVAVVAIVALFLKNRHGDSSTKKTDE